MRLAGVLIGPAILVFIIVQGLSPVLPEPSTEPPANATGLVWDGRAFANKGEFALWLAERGRSYKEWERLHPGSPWATTQPTKATPPSATRTLASQDDGGSNSVVVAILGAGLVLILGLAALGAAVLVRMTVTSDRITAPRLPAPRTVPGTVANGAGSAAIAHARLASAGLAARRGVEAALPRLESAGLAARRGVEAARPHLESAGLAARRGVEAAGPRLAEAGSVARERVEAAAAETAVVGMSLRYAVVTGRFRGALFYAFAAVFSAAIGLATAILL
jgi:hypothetical protein